ncbi:CopG family transcriptional regulator [Mesorhizobium sp. M0036]|uniref:ribbon-helix-helix domain-containing protein n=1 Tax=Mesorhizobium sp. M0036 TaxID=2956853 RepID=UPI0033390C61
MAKSATKKMRSVRTSVMLPAECYEQIQALADANHVSSAWVIRHALLKFLNQQSTQLQLPLLTAEH